MALSGEQCSLASESERHLCLIFVLRNAEVGSNGDVRIYFFTFPLYIFTRISVISTPI